MPKHFDGDAIPEYLYRVTLAEPYSFDEFRAAYFQEQGSFTIFKDAAHAVVSAYQTGLVVGVVREDGNVGV
jgi:hypothetical protein